MRIRISPASTIALLLMLAGAGLTAWGLSKVGRPADVPDLLPWFVLLGVMAALVFGARIRPAVAAMLLAGLVTLASGDVLPLLVVAWFTASSVLVGGFALRHLASEGAARQPLTTFLVGAGLLGTLVGLTAHYPVNYPGVYAIGLATPLVFGWRQVLRWLHAAGDFARGGGVQPPLSERLLECAIAVAALVHFVVAFLPEFGYDALAMHLFVAEALRTRHQWGFDVDTYVWAVLPLLVDWCYAIVNMLGGETAARLLNVAFVLALAWLTRDLVRWAGGTRVGER